MEARAGSLVASPVPLSNRSSAPGRARTLAVLTVAYALSMADRSFLSVAVEPLRRDLGLTDVQVALLGGLAFAVSAGLLSLAALVVLAAMWTATRGEAR